MKIVFTSSQDPTAPNVLEFVEVEDNAGNSINAGEWTTSGGRHTLTISNDAHIAALASFPLELRERNTLEHLLATQETPRAWYRLTPDEAQLIDRHRQTDSREKRFFDNLKNKRLVLTKEDMSWLRYVYVPGYEELKNNG